MVLDQVQQFGTGIRYGLEILHQFNKRVKTKSQKVLGANSYVWRNCRGKTGRGLFFAPHTPIPPNILNRVKAKTGITPELMKGVFEFTDVLKGTILKRHLLQVKNYGTKFPQK